MSGASSRRKGYEAEREVVRALKRAGWDAITSRNARGGSQQGEDVITNFPASIEVKNEQSYAGKLATWLKQAEDNAGPDPAIVVHKRARVANAEGWFVTTDLETLFRLVGYPIQNPYGDGTRSEPV